MKRKEGMHITSQVLKTICYICYGHINIYSVSIYIFCFALESTPPGKQMAPHIAEWTLVDSCHQAAQSQMGDVGELPADVPGISVITFFSNYRSWLVVSAPLKNICQLGWLFPIYGKNKNCLKPPTSRSLFKDRREIPIHLGLFGCCLSNLKMFIVLGITCSAWPVTSKHCQTGDTKITTRGQGTPRHTQPQTLDRNLS
jgi:hypothetical protein